MAHATEGAPVPRLVRTTLVPLVILLALVALPAGALHGEEQGAEGGAGVSAADTVTGVPPGLIAGTRASNEPTLRPGDMIVVQVWRQPEFSGEFFVTDAGVVGHPLYRRIVAAGRSPDEVRGSIMLFLSEFETEPNFVVEVMLQVGIGGEVRQPTVHHLRPGTSISEAVQLAGGITDRGALDRVILRRDGVQYRGDLQDPASDFRRIEIRSGDEIVVERRTDIFREYVVPIISVAGSIASIIRLASPGR